jgi:hypothetical protein
MPARKNAKFPIVLKTIINDVAKSDKTFTMNEKQIRARLRSRFADTHAKNTSWVANNAREYDAIRSSFDAAYAASRTRAAKREQKVKATENADA